RQGPWCRHPRCGCRSCSDGCPLAVSYSNMPSKELAAALEAARAAEEVIRSLFGRNPAVRTKPDQSPVTEADVRAEELIRATLSRHFPSYGFYGEETGQHAMQAESIWLVDPIDGTKSFVRESPFFSTQIALMRGGRLVLGVSNAPAFGELAWAEEGAGAWLNERRVHVRAVADLGAAAISSGNLKSVARSPHWPRYRERAARVHYSRGYGDVWQYSLCARGPRVLDRELRLRVLSIVY